MHRFKTSIPPAAAWLALALAAPAQAEGVALPQFFQGTLARDNALVAFAFSLATSGPLDARTFSHSGGQSGVGQAVAEGGFAPVLTLFSADGEQLALNVGSANGCAGPGSFCWDAHLQLQGLAAGTYWLVLSQDDNLAQAGPVTLEALSSFYSRHEEPHYTAAYLGLPADGGVNFVRVDGSPRSGQWALDIQVDALVSQVPEPPAAWLLALGLAACALRRFGTSRP